MSDAHYRVQVEGDHLKKLTSAKPIQAVAELIWNAADADATRIDLEVDADEFAIRTLIVRDNGHGIPREKVEAIFGKLGGSWKAHGNRSRTKGRILHGKEGKGRFKALALGRVAEWTVRYCQDSKFLTYKITILRDDLTDVHATEPVKSDKALGTGVEVRITELDKSYRSLNSQYTAQSLTEVFALYLTDYSDLSISVAGEKLDPSKLIARRDSFILSPIVDDGKNHAVDLEVIQWLSSAERWMFLCGPEGFPFHRVTPRFHTPGFQFSAYLKSKFVDILQSQGILDLAEMSPLLQAAYDEASERIKDFFRAIEVDKAQSEIENWKTEQIYPYSAEPVSSVELAERQVFEIVALNVKKHLTDFSIQNKRTKAFQLRMIRQAIERGPDDLQNILSEVLDLPEKTR